MPLVQPASDAVVEGTAPVSDGASLWYFDTGGAGAPVVMLHPASGSGHVWVYQRAAFCAAGLRVVGYSRRGHAGSSAGDPASPGTGATDLLELATALGLARFHLVGVAAGGMVAADFAVSHPDRLRSLVLANSIVGVRDIAYSSILERLIPPQFDALPVDFQELGPSYRAMKPGGVTTWMEIHLASRPVTIEQGFLNVLSLEMLAGLDVPTLVLTGDADLHVPPVVADLVARAIPGAEQVTIPAAGHASYWEQPDVFNRTVLSFLGRH